jgi:biotin carboxyl carrier protein
MAQKFLVRFENRQRTVEVDLLDGQPRVRLDEGDWREASLEKVGGSNLYMLLLEARPIEVYVERTGRAYSVTIGRNEFDIEVATWTPAAAAGQGSTSLAAGQSLIKSPMTGTVVDVLVSPGSEVQAGDVIAVIESMKMNNELTAQRAGKVQEVYVARGERVEKGAKVALVE